MVSKQSLKLTLAWALAITLAFFSMSVVYADTITVNSTLDTLATDGSCTLREAINNANNDNQTYSDCAKGSGNDLITFNLSSQAIITLTSQLPTINSNIIIDGSSVASLTISANANSYRAFQISSDGYVTFNALTITKGKMTSSNGGGISNQGIVIISNSTLSDNQAVNGGGIYNTGDLIISNSSVISNKSTYASTLGGGGGAGIHNQDSGRITITNSTLSGNMAYHHGGAIYQKDAAQLSLSYVTIVDNTSDYEVDGWGSGGGIYNSSSKAIKINNTMIAKNIDASTIVIIKDAFGSFTDQGNNLIGVKEPIWSTGLTAMTTLSGTSITPLNPNVGPLQNNGGSTDTHALLAGSPAIDMGNNVGAPATDQRGYARIANSIADIGAYESTSGMVVVSSTIQFSQAIYPINENVGVAVITVTRTSGTGLAQVQVGITGGTATGGVDYDNGSFPQVITFTGSQVNQTITLPITNDLIAEGAFETVTFTMTNVANSVISGNVTTTLQILDDEVASLAVYPMYDLTTNESGSSTTFTLSLTSEPTATVTVNITATDLTEGIVSPTVITFTTLNWNLPQTVTVIGQNDVISDGNIAYTIQMTATSSDPFYQGLVGADVHALNLDNDTAGITVVPINGLTTSEAGDTASFNIILNTAPTATVTMTVMSLNLAEGLVTPTELIFDATNSFTPQLVTVNGVNDWVMDGNITYTIAVTAASADPIYNGINPPDVESVNIDDDIAGVTITPTSGLMTTEWGDAANFNVVLNSQPTATVVITLASLNGNEGTVTPTLLTFDTTNWLTPQLVTVNGVNDWVMDGDMVYTIEMQALSSDPAYGLLAPENVTLINIDDDVAGITLTLPDNFTTTELGGTVSFSLNLTSEPITDTVIYFNSSDTTEGVVTPAAITFTASNWNISQTITITGVDDVAVDGNIAYMVQIFPAMSADLNYNGLTPISDVMMLINLDNDVPPPPLPNVAPVAQHDTVMGLEDTLITPTILSNDYDSDGYIVPATFNLVSAPLRGLITVSITGTISYLPQPNFNGTDIFTYTIKDDNGALSNLATVNLTIKAVNDPPMITTTLHILSETYTVYEDSLTHFTFSASTFYDVDTGDVLTYTTQFLPNWLTFDPTTRAFSGTATRHDLGDWSFLVTATDLAGEFVTQSFTVTVLPVNHPPKLMQPIPDQITLENSPFRFIMATHTFTDIDAGDTLTYTVMLSDGLPLPSWLTFNPTTRVFSGTPANEDVGAWNIKIMAKDNSLASASTFFTITVINVNDAPIAQADLGITPEQTPLTMTVLANDFDLDMGDILTISTVSLPLHGTAMISGEVIVYTPPMNFNGVVTFSYTIVDGHGGTAQAEVTVLVGNQGEIGRPDEVVTDEDVPILIDVLANDTHQGAGLSLLTVSVPLHGVTIISGSQVLYTPKLNFYGTDTFRYIVMNGDLADLGLVTVTVKPVNDGLIARDDLATTAQNISIMLQPLVNDTDIDQVGLSLQSANQPPHGNVTLNGNSLTYTPAPDFTGIDSFSYIATNGFLTATAQIMVEVVSARSPIAVSDFMTTTQNMAAVVAVLANDYDMYNLPLELTTVGTPQYGTATLSGTTVIYTPEPDFVGADYFDYAVTNGNLTNMALVWLEVVSPQVVTPTPPITATPGVTVTWPITWSQTPSTTTIITPPLHGEVVISGGQVIYLPNPDFVGTEIITITVGDGVVTETIVIVVTVDADTVAPTFPSNGLILLAPIEAEILAISRPMFTWQAALDNVRVVSYTLIITPLNQVSFVITTTTTRYTPTFDLPVGSYQWTVIAHDAAGNGSDAVKPETFTLELPTKSHGVFLPMIR